MIRQFVSFELEIVCMKNRNEMIETGLGFAPEVIGPAGLFAQINKRVDTGQGLKDGFIHKPKIAYKWAEETYYHPGLCVKSKTSPGPDCNTLDYLCLSSEYPIELLQP